MIISTTQEEHKRGFPEMGVLSDYITAMVNFYRIVHKDEVVKVYNMHNDDKEYNGNGVDNGSHNPVADRISIEEVDSFMQDNKQYLTQKCISIKGDYFVDMSIIALKTFDEILMAKEGKPLYIPPKEELLKYKDADYFEISESYEKLLEFAQTLYFRKSKAEELCRRIQSYCASYNALENLPYLFAEKGIKIRNEKQLQHFYSLVMDLANHSRLWIHNGYTKNELEELLLSRKL